MINGLKLILISLQASIMVVPAAAADDEQALVNTYLERWDDESLKLLGHLADCVAEKHPDAADAFVRNASDSTALAKDQDRLVDTDCIKQYWFRSSRTNVDPDMYRSMLGEALLKRAHAKDRLPAISEVRMSFDRPRLPQVPISEVHPYYRDMFVIDRVAGELAQYSECLARSQPDGALAVTSTKRGSGQETAAIRRIEAAAVDCIATQPTVNFPSFIRRGNLLLQLYYLTRDAGTPVPPPKS